MRCIVGMTVVLFVVACLATPGESATIQNQYPLAVVKDHFSFFKARTQLPVGTADAFGKNSIAYKPAEAWSVYFKHQTLRGFMNMNQVSVTFVDAKGKRIVSQKANAKFTPELHRLIVEASVNVATMPAPKYVIVDTPESTTTFRVGAKTAN